jgi:hypothetical protein
MFLVRNTTLYIVLARIGIILLSPAQERIRRWVPPGDEELLAGVRHAFQAKADPRHHREMDGDNCDVQRTQMGRQPALQARPEPIRNTEKRKIQT